MPAAQQHGDENAGSEDGERDKADLYVAVGRDRHGDQRGDNVTAEERAGEGRLNGVGFGAKRLKVRVDNAQQHKAHRGHAGVHTEVDDGLLISIAALASMLFYFYWLAPRVFSEEMSSMDIA